MITLERMRRRDLKRVMEIEQQVFPEPWSHTIFVSEVSLRRGRAYRVARDGKDMVGYFGLMFVEDEAHVTTIAVAPEQQGRGLGRYLMTRAMRISREEGVRHVSLEVAVHNERAQALYRRFGFVPVGVRKNYYPKTQEDAIVMFAYDIDTADYEARLARLEAGPS